MTKKELEAREKAVLAAYRDNNVGKAVNYIIDDLIEKYKIKKLYRFRPPEEYEIDAIEHLYLYMCRPMKYEDKGDCKWIDNLEDLVKFYINNDRSLWKNIQKHGRYNIYRIAAENIRNNPKYRAVQDIARNMCVIACATDKISDYMWENYASKKTGVALEYDLQNILKQLCLMPDIKLFPVRYVDERANTEDIWFGPEDYNSEGNDKILQKYILSCLTKNRFPYSQESEWRFISLTPETSMHYENLKHPFIRPNKIILGENIEKNKQFEYKIIECAETYNIAYS